MLHFVDLDKFGAALLVLLLLLLSLRGMSPGRGGSLRAPALGWQRRAARTGLEV